MLVGNSNKILGNISSAEQINRSVNGRSNVNFTSSTTGNLEHQVVEHFGQKSRLLKLLDKAGRMNSEIVSIIVNNIGTAFVAPIFIAFNPISNQDKDTKYYSALRQPLSAVLAIAAQFGITQQFNKFFDNTVYTSGVTQNLDLSMKPNETWLRHKLKKEHKGISDEDLKKLVKETLDNNMKDSVDNKIKDIKSSKADKLFNELEIDHLELGKIDNKNDAYVKRIAEKLHKADKDVMEKEVEKYINLNDEKAANKARLNYDSKVKTTVKDLKKRGDSILPEIKGLDVDKFKSDLAAEQLAEKLGVSENNKAKAIERIKRAGGAEKFLEKCGLSKDLDKQTAENALKNIERHIGETGMLDKAAKTIVNNKIAFTETRLKAVKLPVSIALSVLTLPITCTALNWIYPRFIEIAFPSLVDSKKEGK